MPVSEWSDQEEVFARMLRLARVNQPIVIHLRGVKHDRYGLDVNGACLMLVDMHPPEVMRTTLQNARTLVYIVYICICAFGAVFSYNCGTVSRLQDLA